ncbi:MAG: AAA family ATPase [Acidobacteriota bacterium]
MIETVTIRRFKSLEAVEVGLGQVNVFVGANGSGKSNLLEGVGVLSAAAEGKVNDQSLLQHGVRPGVPSLYKSAFPTRGSPHIFFEAANHEASYAVSLHNPLKDPAPGWRYKTEDWRKGSEQIASRGPHMHKPPNPEQGIAALRAVELDPSDPALKLLKLLQDFVIFSPNTAVLRGTASEPQPRQPIGLSGGRLPDAILEILRRRNRDDHTRRVCGEALRLVDWAASFGAAPAGQMPLSPSAAASPRVIRFKDRFMREKRNVLSGYDASEGALYVLFMAALAAHPLTPAFCAVDNADHGLNPRLARSLMLRFCGWYMGGPQHRQVLLTTHNPLVLDGLPLQDDRVRLFTVSRTETGRTAVQRIGLTEKLRKMADQGWTLSRLWVMGHLGGVANV